MPITPLHFGINGYIATIFRKKIDIASMVLANIVLDIQPFLALIVGLNIPLHGISHSLIGAILICLIASIIYGYGLKWIFSLKKSIFIFINSWVLGGILHVLLDALVHTDVRLFYPISNFNFANHFTNTMALLICAIGYILWILLMDK